jgi:hypothetical protein
VAINNKQGVLYATISLGVQGHTTYLLDKNIKNLDERVTEAETNIISAINVSNNAYKASMQASQSSSVSEEIVKEALESILGVEKDVEDIYKDLENVSAVANQAKAIAEGAVTSATTLKDEALGRANEAWSKAETVATEARSLCATIDKYSVGKYSQAYGLTLEQAHNILEIGMIYVPTKHIASESHEESYSYKKDDVSKTYDREFVPGYLYRWDYIPNAEVSIGWDTVGETPSVYFTTKEPIPSSTYQYWYTDGDNITDKYNNTGVYAPYTLYKWEVDHWIAVATLSGNVNNRAISEVYQTTNMISSMLGNTTGDFSGIIQRLDDVEASIEATTQWTKGSDESGNALLYNLATIDQSADGDGSRMAFVVADKDGNKVINGASIVLNQDAEGSYIAMDADKINFATKSFAIENQSGKQLLSVGEHRVSLGNFGVESDGTRSYLYVGKTSYDDANSGVYIGTDGIGLGKGKFYVKNDGHGSIAGWNIDDTSFSKEYTYLPSASSTVEHTTCFKIDVGANDADPGDVKVLSLTDTYNNTTSTKFYVDAKGYLYAASGSIAGWEFSNTYFYKFRRYEDGDGKTHTITFKIESSNSPDTKVLRVTDTVSSNATDIFYVDAKGKLYAKNADIEGTIHAKAGGTIGGFTIGDTYITSNESKTSYNTSVANSVYVGTDGIGLGQNQFYVNNTGYLIASSGRVGGWELSASSLSAGNLTLSNDGTITTKGDPDSFDRHYGQITINSGRILCELTTGSSVSQKTLLSSEGLYKYNGYGAQVCSVTASGISSTSISCTSLSATNLSCDTINGVTPRSTKVRLILNTGAIDSDSTDSTGQKTLVFEKGVLTAYYDGKRTDV